MCHQLWQIPARHIELRHLRLVVFSGLKELSCSRTFRALPLEAQKLCDSAVAVFEPMYLSTADLAAALCLPLCCIRTALN